MGLFSRLFSSRTETRSAGNSDLLPSSFGVFGGGGYNDTGVTISEQNALICSAVWGCVSIIAQTISTLPAHVVNRSDGGKQYDHPLSKLLAIQPNPYMTPATFREALLTNALLWGGSYAVITRDELGQPDGLYPLKSSDVRPIRREGELIFQARVGSNVYELTPDRVIYLLGWTLDGITPISPIANARQGLGLSVAMERYAAKAFSGGNIGGILQTPPMGDDQMKNFVASWRKNYTGVENAFKVAVLPDPMKFVPTTMDPEKGQLVQSRQAQVLEVARIWKVPPHMLGILDKASYASIEQQNMSFYQQTILPWLVKLEQEFNLKGFLERERPQLEVKFNADAMLRTTTQERYAAYQQGRQGGWLSINDVRRKEGLPPIEGGDSYLSPLNMTPVGQPAPATPPTNPPPPGGDDSTTARSLVADAARRVLTKEAKALARAAKKHAGKPEDLRAWIDQFYQSHEQLVARTFTTPLKAAGLATDPADYAKAHCAESVRAITVGMESGTDIFDLGDEWVDLRPAEIVEAVITQGAKRAA